VQAGLPDMCTIFAQTPVELISLPNLPLGYLGLINFSQPFRRYAEPEQHVQPEQPEENFL
jgi:hypothetical protein